MVSKAEKNIIVWLQKNIIILAAVVAVAASLFIRVKLLPYCGGDMMMFFLPWTEEMHEIGLKAMLANNVGIYSIPLQLMMYASTCLSLDPCTAIKLVPMLFDYLMAGGVAYLAYILFAEREKKVRRQLALAAFCGALLLPIPFLNSAYWGQSDVLYVAFCVYSLCCLLREKYIPAFVLFGLALSIKLQAVFFLPLLVLLYFVNKKFSALYFFILPVVVFATSLPAVFAGAKPTAAFDIYFSQMQYDRIFWLNYPNFTALANNHDYMMWNPIAVVLALLVCFSMLVWMLVRRVTVQGEDMVLLAAWGAMACVMILPGMHERYAYFPELMLLVWAFCKPSWRRILPALLFNLTGYCAYSSFLFGSWIFSVGTLSVLNIIVFLWITRQVTEQMRRTSKLELAGEMSA